ncbi:unnamed protein product [Trichogramma brassicae]|uniref:Reverse transcriptase domain-containing protein n=1 Tax=Trichogramma brassicae TaxID=86971 RepID=A0A6H5IBS3_9HYME|nr:unnamed protein product [Trichogramma brassicae]
MRTPEYLLRIISSYLSARSPRLTTRTTGQSPTESQQAFHKDRSGWGPSCERQCTMPVLRLTSSQANVRIVGFADDIALVAVAKHLWQIDVLI